MVYRKTAATEERKEARRRTLLEAAVQLFGCHGYHATTVPMIVAAAASSTGSFYAYFRNKEDIFAAVLEELGKRFFECMQIRSHALGNDAVEMDGAIQRIFLYMAENPGEARILIVDSCGLSPRLEQIGRAILKRHKEYVCSHLEAAPEVYEPENPEIAARCVVGAVYEAVFSWLEEDPETRLPAQKVAALVSSFLQRALRRRP
jgi:AcrR family transcriptional regulator